jgi:haloalkane dehalogenase
MINPVMPYTKKTITVNGRTMACVDEGEGDPIVFLHGNATSSYMWRNIMPHMEGLGRLIAIDNIGQGDSDKLPNSGDQSYAIEEHQTYIDGVLDALGVSKNVTLVMHDWGGPMGIDWARRHENAIKGLAHCETLVINHTSYDDYGPIAGLLKKIRGPEGVNLALEENFFVEKVFVGGVMRDLDDETMMEIRRPYKNKGEDRRVTLSWVRQIPIEGKPENVAALLEANSKWMASHEIPKLFIDVKPGQIVFQADLDIIQTWPNQTEITVKGLHHPQEDSPDDIGRGLRDWYQKIG